MRLGISSNTGRPSGKHANLIEGAALSASMLCLVHCLALPVLLLALPGVLGLFVGSEAFHFVALGFVAPTALVAFTIGYRRHRAIGPALLGVGGVSCLGFALVPGILDTASTWLTVVGSLLFIAGHTTNWRLRSRAL